jgi:hypothetical protein
MTFTQRRTRAGFGSGASARSASSERPSGPTTRDSPTNGGRSSQAISLRGRHDPEGAVARACPDRSVNCARRSCRAPRSEGRYPSGPAWLSAWMNGTARCAGADAHGSMRKTPVRVGRDEIHWRSRSGTLSRVDCHAPRARPTWGDQARPVSKQAAPVEGTEPPRTPRPRRKPRCTTAPLRASRAASVACSSLLEMSDSIRPRMDGLRLTRHVATLLHRQVVDRRKEVRASRLAFRVDALNATGA